MQANMQTKPVTPGTPDSMNILVGAASYAAHNKRHLQSQQHQNKSIMNCFRDRSSSTTSRANHMATVVQFEKQKAASGVSSRPEAVIFLRELQTRSKKLSLLKSSSTRDLSRLNSENSNTAQPGTVLLTKNPSLEIFSTMTNTSSSGASPSVSPYRCKRECCANCTKRLSDMKQRIRKLENDLQAQNIYTKELETKLNELSKVVANINQKRVKKMPSMRKKTTPVAGSSASAGTNGCDANGNGAVNGSVTQTSKLVAWMNLSNWWKSRPSIEMLKQQNIYNDEPCFDTEIELVLKHEQHPTVPRIVVDCCDLIESKYRRSTQSIEGIYRQCGDYNKIQTLRFSIDANDYDSLRQPNIDIHTLTGVLKLFLREIKSPLISTNEAKTFMGRPTQWLLTDLPTKISILKRLIRSLPEINRDTMVYLFAHFNRLTKVPLQQISAETLAISVTPSIFHTASHGVNMLDIQALLRESETLADSVMLMIEYQSRIFEYDGRHRQRLSMRNLKKTLS